MLPVMACALISLHAPMLRPIPPPLTLRMCEPSTPEAADDAASSGLSPLAALAATQAETPAVDSPPTSSAACAATQTPDERRRSLLLGAAAPIAAAGLYAFQRLNPVNPVSLLAAMESRSPPVNTALANGKPTLIEFYAPWCIACRESAPNMLRFEKRYDQKVNFVVCNAEDPQYAQLVRLFGVDGIPHLALIDEQRKLRSTLVGEVPASVVESSIAALAEGRTLPYDALNAEPEAQQAPGSATSSSGEQAS